MQALFYGDNYGPAELDPAVWNIVKQGTDAGVIVVAAAGNGSQNLDSSVYADYRNRGDSGAIIVGAGSANKSHTPLYFSSYGNRVNVQAWGEQVFSTGYGDFAQYGGDKHQQYTSGFAGTSSASALIASLVTYIQSYAVQKLNRRFTPLEMRNLLITTGFPQGPGNHIGPFPNTQAIVTYIDSLNLPPVINPIGDKNVDYPTKLKFTITASDPEGKAVVLSATMSNGATLSTIGATFTDNKNNTGTFVWAPTFTQAGSYIIRFQAMDPDGKSSTQNITITVRKIVF